MSVIRKIKLPDGNTYELGSSAGNVSGLNDATITINQNGKEAGHFTTNQANKGTIDLTDTTYSNATTTASGLMSAADKKRLDGMADGANKVTDNSQLINGAGYQTASQVSSAISAAVGDINSFDYEIVTLLPESGTKGKIYLIADTHSDSNDSYDEYMWIGSKYEKIGNTDVDLSQYVKTDDSRLSNARPASDVYDWAKAKTKPSYTASEVGALAADGKAKTAGTADTANNVAWANTNHPSTFPPSAHNHDDRYYTESEIDSKLSGKQASGSYAQYGAAPTDLNSATKAGMYRVNSGHKNSPADWGQLLVVYGAGDTIAQIYFDYSNDKAYIRSGNPSNVGGTGSWSAWKEIVYTDDSRLSDARPASDVYSWAKQASKPSYSSSEISGLGNLAGKSTNGSTANFLRGDGSWVTPPNDNTWRGITDSYSGTATGTSLSQKGANDLYNALHNGYANSAGSANSATSASHAGKVDGTYSGNGGQQGPGYFGKNFAGFLMSNAAVNGDSDYKNWLYMDNYSGNDVGGATAIGVDRMEARLFIMQSDANRNKWNNSAEVYTTAHKPTCSEIGACSSSDSRLSNARPASDVYGWAKQSSKPSYSASEISGLGNLATKSTNGSTASFLRGDGSWATPPNTQYSAISTTWIDQNLT